MLRALAIAAVLAACGPADDQAYTIVTVQARPAVRGVDKLKVTLTSGSTTEAQDLTLGTQTFPVTFSFSSPTLTGAVQIQVDATDTAGLLVGSGTSMSSIGADSASVMLDSTDFVVNTDFADDQFPSDFSDTHGMQASATSDGNWSVIFRGTCPTTGCNMFARRFDSAGQPLSTQVAAGTNAFPVSTNLTTGITTPAIVGAGTTTLALWNYSQPSPGTIDGVACRSIDAQGRANPDEVLFTQDVSTDNVSASAMGNSNVAVVWVGLSPRVVRGGILRPDCTAVAAPVTVSTTAAPVAPVVAANGTTILYAWTTAGNVYVRLSNNGTLQGASDIQFLPKTATEEIEFVRVVPLGTGFGVLVRWALTSVFMGPGRIELYRTNAQGAVLGTPVLITSRSGSDFGSRESFGAATRPDGTLFVTWHACESNGDGQGCGVFGRAFRVDGSPIGDEITIPTTTVGDQSNPSVAALPDAFAVVWKDDSMQMPDVAGSAVRARIVYPSATGTSQ